MSQCRQQTNSTARHHGAQGPLCAPRSTWCSQCCQPRFGRVSPLPSLQRLASPSLGQAASSPLHDLAGLPTRSNVHFEMAQRTGRSTDTPRLWAQSPWWKQPRSINFTSSKQTQTDVTKALTSKSPAIHKKCPRVDCSVFPPIILHSCPMQKAKAVKASSFLNSEG